MPSACAWIWPKAPTIWSFFAHAESLKSKHSLYKQLVATLWTCTRYECQEQWGSYGRQRFSKTSWAVHWRLCKLQKFEQVTVCWRCTFCTFIPWLPSSRSTATCCRGFCSLFQKKKTFLHDFSRKLKSRRDDAGCMQSQNQIPKLQFWCKNSL